MQVAPEVDAMVEEAYGLIDTMNTSQRRLFVDTAMNNIHTFSQHVANEPDERNSVVGYGVMIHALAALVGYANAKDSPADDEESDAVEQVNSLLSKYATIIGMVLGTDAEEVEEPVEEERFFYGQYL